MPLRRRPPHAARAAVLAFTTACAARSGAPTGSLSPTQAADTSVDTLDVVAAPLPTPSMGDQPVALTTRSLITVAELNARLGTAARAAADSTAKAPTDSLDPRAAAATEPPPSQPAAVRGDTGRAVERWIKAEAPVKRISVSFAGDSLGDVLTLFSTVSGRSILQGNDPELATATFTADIQDQPWNLALESLLKSKDLRAIEDPETGIITVVTEAKAMASRVPEIIRLRYINAEDILPTLRAIIGATTGGQGGPASPDVIDAVNTGADESTTLLVYTNPEKFARVRAMVNKLDRRRPTVSINARMMFVNRSALEKMGFSYAIVSADQSTNRNASTTRTTTAQPGVQVSPLNGTGTTAGNMGSAFSLMQRLALGGPTSLNIFFDALTSHGLAETEAAPVITTTSDQSATLNVGEFFILPNQQQLITGNGTTGLNGANSLAGVDGVPNAGYATPVNPYGTQYGVPSGGQNGAASLGVGNGYYSDFRAGTKLTVTPRVLPNGKIRVKINIARSSAVLGSDGRSLTGPEQSAETEVTVDNEEQIVIGGLTVTSKTETKAGIPVLSALPLVGWLFRNRSQATLYQDLVIVVQPRVAPMTEDDAPTVP